MPTSLRHSKAAPAAADDLYVETRRAMRARAKCRFDRAESASRTNRATPHESVSGAKAGRSVFEKEVGE